MKAIVNILTAIAVVVGIAGVVIGIVTGTAHNIVLGVMMVIVGYVNRYEEAKARKGNGGCNRPATKIRSYEHEERSQSH